MCIHGYHCQLDPFVPSTLLFKITTFPVSLLPECAHAAWGIPKFKCWCGE